MNIQETPNYTKDIGHFISLQQTFELVCPMSMAYKVFIHVIIFQLGTDTSISIFSRWLWHIWEAEFLKRNSKLHWKTHRIF